MENDNRLRGQFPRRIMNGLIHALAIAIVIILGAARIFAQNQPPTSDLTAASLEELMSIEVTTASKREQKLSETAAAIYVITQEDIRRSTATSVPELLR